MAINRGARLRAPRNLALIGGGEHSRPAAP
jgi:hypothetical protein